MNAEEVVEEAEYFGLVLAPVGSPFTVKPTLPLKPLAGVTVTV